MTTEVNTENGTDEKPTATEFIPAEQVPGPNRTGKPMVRGLQLRDGKGFEVGYHEPYDDEVDTHAYICDECGQAEDLESDMEAHLRTQH